jgi:nitroimidazol reductase NimA-like FMN-containing flavoprotein (pyridoxamine 5'-phosphate oxidase superfamily)
VTSRAGEGVARELVVLSRPECLALLAATDFGRVVMSAGPSQVPLIRPVNYRFDERSQSIVFRTLEGSKFHTLVRSARACFEIDGHDPGTESGWSVIVIGTTERITRAADIDRAERLDVRTWANGRSAHWMRIRARTVSGRRLGPVGEPR